MPTIDVKGHLIDFPENLSPEELNNAVGSAAKQLPDDTSFIDKAKNAGMAGIELMAGGMNPALPYAIKAGRKIANDPVGSMDVVAENLPTAGAIAGPLAVTLPTGGMGIPAAIAASALGASGGEGLRQMYRRARGFEPSPKVEVPFVGGEFNRIPGVSNETSNMLQQGIIGAAGEGFGQSMKLIPPLGKKAIGLFSPATREAISERFKNPVGVKTAGNREQLGNILANATKKVNEKISVLDKEAKAVLEENKTISKKGILNKLLAIRGKVLGRSGVPSSKEISAPLASIDEAIDTIRKTNPLPDIRPGTIKLQQTIEEGTGGMGKIVGGETGIPGRKGVSGDVISEQQVKDLMDRYRKNVKWDDPSFESRKEIRKALDSVLKQNPKYRSLMAKEADLIRTVKVIEKKFALKYDPVNGTFATDATSGKWTPKLLEGGKPESSNALNKLGKESGINLQEKARLLNIKEQFEGAKTQGSRLVNLGRYLGGSTGAVVGAALDKTGGVASGAMVDLLRLATQNKLSPLSPTNVATLLKIGDAKNRKSKNAVMSVLDYK